MKDLEMSAKTVEEAIQQALEQLGVDRKEVEITVLKEGRTGVLGLGAEEAKIRVRLLASITEERDYIAETAKGVLEMLLGGMGITASIVPCAQLFVEGEEESTAPIAFNIEGEDLGILIGRRGQTLACLQYIVRLIIAHQAKAWSPIIVDVEGYKQRRYESLRLLAWRVAEQVKAKEVPFRLAPMPAYERRVIHLVLADHPDVTTESTGEGEARRIVVSLKEN